MEWLQHTELNHLVALFFCFIGLVMALQVELAEWIRKKWGRR